MESRRHQRIRTWRGLMVHHETHELLVQNSHGAQHVCMQLVGRFEDFILCRLDAVWKGVLLGVFNRLKGKKRQVLSREIFVNQIGSRADDGRELYDSAGRHCIL